MTEKENTAAPSMERRTQDQKLNKQFEHLKQEWEAISSKPKPSRRTLLRSSLTEPRKPRNMSKALQLLDNSPRNLMSSLQHHHHPHHHKGRPSPTSGSGGTWKVRTNDVAVQEILWERMAAVESGKLKGRRLFEDMESINDIDSLGSGKDDFVHQESEVRSVWSYESDHEHESNVRNNDGVLVPYSVRYSSTSPPSSPSASSSSFLCEECMEKEGAVIVSFEEEKRHWTRRFRVMVFLAIGLVGLVISLILSSKNFGRRHYRDQFQVVLVPT